MRIAAGIIGILGALFGGLIGLKWWSDLSSELGQMAAKLAGVAGMQNEFASMRNGTYALLGCSLIGLIISIMVIAKKGAKMINACLLLVAGIAPMLFWGKAAIAIPMALAGVFAFFVKQPASAPAQAPVPQQAPPA